MKRQILHGSKKQPGQIIHEGERKKMQRRFIQNEETVVYTMEQKIG